jgi:hypothetical protein
MPLTVARAPGVPVLGSVFGYFRDPLAFFRSAARLGPVVDLRRAPSARARRATCTRT